MIFCWNVVERSTIPVKAVLSSLKTRYFIFLIKQFCKKQLYKNFLSANSTALKHLQEKKLSRSLWIMYKLTFREVSHELRRRISCKNVTKRTERHLNSNDQQTVSVDVSRATSTCRKKCQERKIFYRKFASFSRAKISFKSHCAIYIALR